MMANDPVVLRQLSSVEAHPSGIGDADVRGWPVFDATGEQVGFVHDLLLQHETGAVRYLDVAILTDGRDRGRHVLIPLGLTQRVKNERRLTTPILTARLLNQLPAFDHGAVTRADECILLGRLMGLPGPIVDAGPLFYEHSYFAQGPFGR